MATDIPQAPTDVRLLYDFLGERIEHGKESVSLDQALSDFEEYRRQLTDLRTKIEVAEQSIALGKAKPLDADEVKAHVRERLSQQGIAD